GPRRQAVGGGPRLVRRGSRPGGHRAAPPPARGLPSPTPEHPPRRSLDPAPDRGGDSGYVNDNMAYRTKPLSELTGIPRATLISWERRYALVEPRRSPAGYRLYDDDDVAFLRDLKALVDSG